VFFLTRCQNWLHALPWYLYVLLLTFYCYAALCYFHWVRNCRQQAAHLSRNRQETTIQTYSDSDCLFIEYESFEAQDIEAEFPAEALLISADVAFATGISETCKSFAQNPIGSAHLDIQNEQEIKDMDLLHAKIPLAGILKKPQGRNSTSPIASTFLKLVPQRRARITAPWRQWSRWGDCNRLHEPDKDCAYLDCCSGTEAERVNYKTMLQ
jgi:hypothetical protein